MKMNYYLNQFEQDLITGNVKKAYARVMKSCVSEFFEFAELQGYRIFNEMTRELIGEYHHYISTRPLKKREGTMSSSMIRQQLNSVNSFFKFLLKMEVLEENPVDGYRLPRVIQGDRIVPTQEDVNAMIAACENLTDYTIILLAFGCGLRRAEIERLDYSGVNFRTGILKVIGKNDKIRRIQLTERIAKELENYFVNERPKFNVSFKERNRKAFMLSQRGFRMSGSAMNKRLKYLGKKAEVEISVTLHSLRHAIATILIDRGMKLEKVQEFLSHTWIDTTVIYTKFTKRRI